MNKNFSGNKSIQSQSVLQIQLTNIHDKIHQIEKTKNNQCKNKPRIKQYNKTQNINQNNKQKKKNNKAYFKTKSKSRPNQKKLSFSKSDENLINSQRIQSFNQNQKNNNKNKKNVNNNKINIFPQPCSLDKKTESDITNLNVFRPCKSNQKNIKNIAKNNDSKNNIKSNTYETNFENLKYIPLNDTSSLFNALQNSYVIYKVFEEKFLKKNNFEIDAKTLEIITKNSEACKELRDQKFWILYVEYLINNNLLTNEKQFLSVINEAFSYMGYDCAQLRTYYLQKIKKYSPCFLHNGSFDQSDDVYFSKLNKSTYNFIKSQKEVNSSNVKLKSTNKKKLYKLIFDDEDNNNNIIFNDENKAENGMKENNISIGNKDTGIDEKEFDIIDNSGK